MIKKMLLATVLATTTLASAAPIPVTTEATRAPGIQIKVQSRTSSETQVVVAYTIDSRAFKLTVIRGTTSTFEVNEGGRTVLRGVVAPDGSGQLTNHRGRTYSLSQMRANPALQDEFDLYAMAVLDAKVESYLVTGAVALNPCLAHWALFIACGVGSYIALCCTWHAGDSGWGVECDCPVVD